MTDLIGESVLLEKEEYVQLKFKADLGESLLSHMLRNYTDDQWVGNTRFMLDECALAFWGETVDWQLDEEGEKDEA